MVEVLPPPKPEMPIAAPGMRISTAPFPHYLFVEDYEYYDNLGRDPLQQNLVWSIKDDDERVEKLKQVIEEHPVEKQHQKRKILLKAVVRGDVAIVKYLVSSGLRVQPDFEKLRQEEENKTEDDEEEETGSVPDKDDPSVAPLHAAAAHNKLEIIKIFIEDAKVEVDARDEFNRTALMAAANGDDAEIMRYLLGLGADPTARCDAEGDLVKEWLGVYAGADALEYAAAQGNLETVRMLLEHPFAGSTRKRKSRAEEEPGVWVTPLAIKGAAGSSFELLKLLLERGAYPMEDANGKTKAELLDEEQRKAIVDATPIAADTGDLDSLKLLLSYQYLINEDGKPTFPGGFPEELHKSFIWGAYTAITSNKLDKFQYLASFGLKEHDSMSLDDVPEDQTLNVQHLLEKAVEAGAIDSVKFLIDKYGAKPNSRRIPSGIQSLFFAAANNKTEMVRYLLESHHMDIHFGNGRYVTGPTALNIAITLKSFGSIELLLRHGGPIDHIDEEIQHIDKPMTAVLRAVYDNRTLVRLQTEENAKSYTDSRRNDWQDFNPYYVILHLVPSDKSWISKLQPRKSDEELLEVEVREYGEKARELSKEEGAKLKDLDADDPRRLMVAFPTLQHRVDELDGDDDLCPAWKPAFLPVSREDDE
ncbi:ankyrin repeat-containing domain protein [Lophiotrema nucula]|uniref:Ankyrin repeat-containing domain protein n=1 Tax=Lophiotrema nucula TaxID=690887 RepID=A0A6A5YM73_9PLEO|nr:ankyrin repeat-containing domain protein [Lophiotrema nucula]